MKILEKKDEIDSSDCSNQDRQEGGQKPVMFHRGVSIKSESSIQSRQMSSLWLSLKILVFYTPVEIVVLEVGKAPMELEQPLKCHLSMCKVFIFRIGPKQLISSFPLFLKQHLFCFLKSYHISCFYQDLIAVMS